MFNRKKIKELENTVENLENELSILRNNFHEVRAKAQRNSQEIAVINATTQQRDYRIHWYANYIGNEYDLAAWKKEGFVLAGTIESPRGDIWVNR